MDIAHSGVHFDMNDTARISAFIDVPFYVRETGIAFSSVLDAAQHFIRFGQVQNLSPSPFILWGWIKAEHPAIINFDDFLSYPLQACTHPAIKRDIYFSICQITRGDIATLIAALAKAELDSRFILPSIAEAGRRLGYQSLYKFMQFLTEIRSTNPVLEMDVFSSKWYLSCYEDVRHAGANPFRHYFVSGWQEGRDPSPRFSTSSYLADHPDVKESGQNPLVHFLQIGDSQGRTRRPSTAYFPLIRYQTKTGELPAQYVPFINEDDDAVQQLCIDFSGAKVVIIVPFYEHEELVPIVCGSLQRCSAELASNKAAIILVNDSPEYHDLIQPLQTWADLLSKSGINVALFNSEHNRGFIYSSNIGLRCANILNCYCLLLNSDTELRPGSLSEMLHVASMDDRFAFINPMSNNATIASLGLETTSDAVAAARNHAAVIKSLPRYIIVPTCVGFCLLIKPEVIKLFGYLDKVYGKGYNEENDFIMRSNRKGYISVIAAHAFVSHIGEQSFSSSKDGKKVREEHNRNILIDRYPEFTTAIDNYFSSPEAQARRIVERYEKSVDVLIDASSLSGIANGTSVLAQELVPRLIQNLGINRCAIRTSAENLRWLGLVDVKNLQWLKPEESCYSKIAFRLSQPYRKHDIISLSSHAAKTVFFMLDTISDDCLYLRDQKVHDLWEWVAEYADAVIYNSDYTMNKFQNRFSFNPRTVQRVSYHSFNVRDYNSKHKLAEEDSISNFTPYILIVGNYYQHKVIEMALRATDKVGLPRVLIGAKFDSNNLVSFESGSLTHGEVAMLYKNAAVILFPSLYEGFGFPLMEGFASNKPTIVHDNQLNRYIFDRIGSPPSVVFFGTFTEIESCVVSAMKLGSHFITEASEDGWDRSVQDIISILNEVDKKNILYEHVVRREKSINGLT